MLPSLAEIELEKRRRMPLRQFVRESWHVLEPTTPLVWNWHLDVLCDHVQALLVGWVEAGRTGVPPEVQNLLLNVPPGSMKSRIVSVCAPAWMWIRNPSWRVLCLSANPRVALRDSMYCRELVGSDWYRDAFQPSWAISDTQDSKSLFKNTAGGFRAAFGFFAKITGDRADALIVDDPHDAQEVHSKTKRVAVLEKWDAAIANRVNDPNTSVRILIMQRLHEEDLTGHVLKQGGWEHVSIPQEFELAQKRRTWIGWEDPRTVEGELMFTIRFPENVLAAERRRLGAAGYAGQHQQRPAPATGLMLQRGWWKRWKVLPRIRMTIHSWDCAQGENPGAGSSYVVGECWAWVSATEFYLLDQVRGHMTPLETEKAMLDSIARWSKKWGKPSAIIVENKAAGPAVMERVRKVVPGVIPSNPLGSKEERVQAVSPTVESGCVWIPDTDVPGAEWVGDFIEETASFPRGAHDDQVDCATQAIIWLRNRGSSAQGYPIDPKIGAGVPVWQS